VNILANAVRVTLGPRAERRARAQFRRSHVTKDGVSVAKEIELKDKFENMGAQMVKEVASKPRTTPATHHHRYRAAQSIVTEA